MLIYKMNCSINRGSWFIQWKFVLLITFESKHVILTFSFFLKKNRFSVHTWRYCLLKHTQQIHVDRIQLSNCSVINKIKYNNSFRLYRYIPCAMRTNPKWRGKRKESYPLCIRDFDWFKEWESGRFYEKWTNYISSCLDMK